MTRPACSLTSAQRFASERSIDASNPCGLQRLWGLAESTVVVTFRQCLIGNPPVADSDWLA